FDPDDLDVFPGIGNIDDDPLFIRNPDPGPDGTWGTDDDDYGDLDLSRHSPSIDAGDNTAVPADAGDLDDDGDTTEQVPFDAAGNPRFVDDPTVHDTGCDTAPIVDMGAYEVQPCQYIPADQPQPACGDRIDCSCATCEDRRVELCEVTGYGYAWRAGCNDDMAGTTRAGYLWRSGECYCWDDVTQDWYQTSCPAVAWGCCEGVSQGRDLGTGFAAGIPAPRNATAQLQLVPVDSGRYVRTREVKLSVTVEAPQGASVMALEFQIPIGWKVTTISDAGEWDGLHRKVKWGPFFQDLSRTVTFKARGLMVKAQGDGFSGIVSFDGVNYPVAIE
ncbi:MAG: hypothetical protein WBE26_05110, partial [Phycisphaerae bacterium]